jgi:hypothetical protein
MPRFVARSNGPVPFSGVPLREPYRQPRDDEVLLCYDLEEVRAAPANASPPQHARVGGGREREEEAFFLPARSLIATARGAVHRF